jgi:hypothetical protein
VDRGYLCFLGSHLTLDSGLNISQADGPNQGCNEVDHVFGARQCYLSPFDLLLRYRPSYKSAWHAGVFNVSVIAIQERPRCRHRARAEPAKNESHRTRKTSFEQRDQDRYIHTILQKSDLGPA